MDIVRDKRCIIGEGPIYNSKENTLYFTDGFACEYCRYDFKTKKVETLKTEVGCAAIAFDKHNRIIVSRSDGVFVLNENGETENIYDPLKYEIKNANDMKVGPDGRIYVGTQSSKRLGLSDDVDGKLYCIHKNGEVEVLLDGLILSNGMDWSMDEKRFYHTDSDTDIIKEYDFDYINGRISATGREIKVNGVDGFTIDREDRIYATRWGYGDIAVIDIHKMAVEEYIKLPCEAPSSCAFGGEGMEYLIVTSASWGQNIEDDKMGGYTVLIKGKSKGREPYVYG